MEAEGPCGSAPLIVAEQEAKKDRRRKTDTRHLP